MYAKKEKNVLLMFQNITQIVKNMGTMALFYGQKTFSIVKKNYIQKQWGFLLSDFSSFL